jgi:hypothetical protein
MPSTAKQKFKCVYCPRSFPRPASLGSHVYRAHPEHREAIAMPASPAKTKAPVTTGRIEEADVRPEKRGVARPMPIKAFQEKNPRIGMTRSRPCAPSHVHAALRPDQPLIDACL